MTSRPAYDAIIVGGGFFGCSIALHLRLKHGLERVAVIEREPQLMLRASLINQARIHQGHHYPRDFVTANRSRASFPRFAHRHRRAVFDAYDALYAVASRNSLVSAKQFVGMMRSIGASCEPASRRHVSLFDPAKIEAVYRVEEFAFDAVILAEEMRDDLDAAGVDVLLSTEVTHLKQDGQAWGVALSGSGRPAEELTADRIFECTYGRTGGLPGAPPARAKIKFELCEVCLVEPPKLLGGVGITIMDGPFFSCMPFPSAGLHSLTHVRWTPRQSWISSPGDGCDPYAVLARHDKTSNFVAMRADAARLVPVMADAVHARSLFEVKAVLVANEDNDGRPILIEGSPAKGGVMKVLGGKMDNVYDVLVRIDEMSEQKALEPEIQ